MKKVLPFTGELAPINHMISASIGEVVCDKAVCVSPHSDSSRYILSQAACLVRVPTEVIKTRTQTSSYGAAHASSLAAAKLVFKNQGLSGFYRGFGITVMREES